MTNESMTRFRNPQFAILLALAIAALVYGGLRGLGYTGGGDEAAPPVPAGDQEVAWIHAATSGPSWERFVAGVHRARREWPELQVDDSRAFLDQTTAIPEVVLGVSGSSGRLRIRWYKLTSETPSAQWVRRLARRNPPPAIAAAVAPDAWAAIGLLAAHADTCPPSAAALEWDDDPYSLDLSNQFKLAFHQSQWPPVLVRLKRSIPFSVGGFDRPNAWEAEAVERLLREQWSPLERQLLVLPAAPAAARRVLRALTGAAPLAGRNLVAISGDSMNINTVYRDADIAWNIRAVPVPVVFFTHQNPVAWDEPEDRGQRTE